MSELEVTLARIGACRFLGTDGMGGASVYCGTQSLADEIESRTPGTITIPNLPAVDTELSRGMRPMHALLASLAACGAMDAILILLKQREPVGHFSVKAIGNRPLSTPAPFEEIRLTIDAPGVDEARLLSAIRLAYTKYCSVGSSLDPGIAIRLSVSSSGGALGVAPPDHPGGEPGIQDKQQRQ